MRSASIRQRDPDVADGHEAVVNGPGVDGPQVRVQHEELHTGSQRPVSVIGGNELERDRQERTTRDVAPGLVVAVDRVVVLQAKPRRDGRAHVERVRGVGKEGIARGHTDTHVDALLAGVAGQGLALGLEREEQARIEGEVAEPLRVVEPEAQPDVGVSREAIVGTRVIGVGNARGEDVPPGRRQLGVEVGFEPELRIRGLDEPPITVVEVVPDAWGQDEGAERPNIVKQLETDLSIGLQIAPAVLLVGNASEIVGGGPVHAQTERNTAGVWGLLLAGGCPRSLRMHLGLLRRRQ